MSRHASGCLFHEFRFKEEAGHTAEKDWRPEDIPERVFEMANVDMMYSLYYSSVRSDCEVERVQLENGDENEAVGLNSKTRILPSAWIR